MQAFVRMALACSVAIACAGQSEPRDSATVKAPPDTVVNPHAFWAKVGVQFHPESVTVGDTIGAMIVDRVNVQRAFDSSAVGSVAFRGDLQLNGRLIPHFDSDVNVKCFEADSVSASRMPRWRGDMRRPWFCFGNQEDPRVAKAIVPSDASIVIDRFIIHFTMSDGWNEGRLRRIVPGG